MNKSVGSVVTEQELKKEYNVHFQTVLGNKIDYIPKSKKGERRKYKVKETLPTQEEYKAMQTERFTTTVGNLIGDAFSEIQSLAEEMRDAYENTPDSLKEADVGSRRGEAADALENIQDAPDVPEMAETISCYYCPAFDLSSRSKRANDTGDMLSMAADAIRDFVAERKEEDEEFEDGELNELADECERVQGELEGVEFPGMFG